MKLKKIASLLLAGVMAVSMLAGCNGKTPDPEENNGGESNSNTATYSVALGDKLADTLKEKKIDGIVSFANSSVDQAALEDALGNLERKQLHVTASGNGLGDLIDVDAVADFKDAADLDRATLVNDSEAIYDYKYNINKTVKVGDIFYVDATVDMDKALDRIVAEYEDAFGGLKKSVTIMHTDGEKEVFDFKYTVSVSVVNVPAPDVTIYTGSTNFIAVTVTRTVA